MVRALSGLAIVAAFAASPAMASNCFRYGEIVTLSGHYAAAVLPLADGLVRDIRTDEGRRADVLTLDTPLCVNGDVVSAAVPVAMSVQVHCGVQTIPDGGALSLSGRLVGARLGNGHTPVLLVCQ